MPDEFVVVSPEELAERRGLPPEMLRDLQTVAAAEPAAVDDFTQALRQESGVLTEERLDTLSRQFFDEANAESVLRTT